MKSTETCKLRSKLFLCLFAVVLLISSFLIIGFDVAWAKVNNNNRQYHDDISSMHSWRESDRPLTWNKSDEKPSEDDEIASSKPPSTPESSSRRVYAYTPDSSSAAVKKVSWISMVFDKIVDLVDQAK